MSYLHNFTRVFSVVSVTSLVTLAACKFPNASDANGSSDLNSEAAANDPEFCTADSNNILVGDSTPVDLPAAGAYNNSAMHLAPIVAPSPAVVQSVASTLQTVVKPQTITNQIVLGQDVINEIAAAVKQEIVNQVRSRGDLTAVNFQSMAPKTEGLKMNGDIKQITDAISQTLDITKVQINFSVYYNHGQLYNKAVAIVSDLVANYPLKGRSHPCIGGRIGRHKGFVYNRFVGPMINSAISEAVGTAQRIAQKNLQAANLGKNISVKIAQTSTRAAQTTLTMSSTSANFPARTVTYSQAKTLAQQVAAELKKIEAAAAAQAQK